MPVQSPCVACCKLDQQDICLGCYRSLAEIANWRMLDEDSRQAAVDAAKQRGLHYQRQTAAETITSPITRAKCLAAQQDALWLK